MEWGQNVDDDDEKVRLSKQTFAECLWLCVMYSNRFCSLKNKHVTVHYVLFFLTPAACKSLCVCVADIRFILFLAGEQLLF